MEKEGKTLKKKQGELENKKSKEIKKKKQGLEGQGSLGNLERVTQSADAFLPNLHVVVKISSVICLQP